MSYFVVRSTDHETLWNPALAVGIVYVGEMWANSIAMRMDSGLRFGPDDTDWTPPGRSDEATLTLGPFTDLVRSLLDRYTRTSHATRRKQLLAVLPESLVLIERAGGS